MAQDISAVSHTEWREMIAPYQQADTRQASSQLAITLGLLGAAFLATYLAVSVSPWLALSLAPLPAGLLVRTFIIMHDCGHGSFFPSRRANEVVGAVTGVLTLTPFAQWRRDHALHHASSGDLERRGHGDVPTITVAEYRSRSWWGRVRYRLFRFPPMLLALGTLNMIVWQRIPPSGNRLSASVWGTNAAIAGAGTIVTLLLGLEAILLAYLPAIVIAAVAGTWLFYVQHQFEDTYWERHAEWDYATAAVLGSSHLKLPAVLQWFTGNIGLHHVHHLGPRIPNYRLVECHERNPLFHQAKVVTLASGFHLMRLALWDEGRRRLVSFREAARERPGQDASVA